MVYRKYKLGDLVEQYDEINLNGEFADIDDLQGINSNKYFQECKSNKNDIDLYRYRICRHGMFSYNRATSRNGEKISIALRTGGDCIVSPSYYCFRVKDEEVLCPEYLDIWFKRPVFDRYARFNSWGSATEFFTFDDFCATEIMLPSISEQRKIVHDYQVITDRIELLRKMNEKLEEQASLHFESIFGRYIPDGLNVSDIIPDGWTVATVGDFCKANSATFSGRDDVLLYLDTGSITNNYISGLQVLDTNTDEIPSRARRKVSNGDIVYSTVRPNLRHYGIIFNPPKNMIVSTGFAVMSMLKNAPVCSEIIYMWLTRNSVVNVLHSIAENSVSTYPSIVSADLEQIKMVVPSEDECAETGGYYKSVFQTIDCNNREISKLERLAILFSNQLAKGA